MIKWITTALSDALSFFFYAALSLLGCCVMIAGYVFVVDLLLCGPVWLFGLEGYPCY